MTSIVCVTCSRDLHELRLQVRSYIKWLPTTYKLIYVIEDIYPQNWINNWNIEFAPLLVDYQVEIVIGQNFMKDWIEPFTRGHEGWIRSALLKLVVVSTQYDICWVTDTKDFLIGPVQEKLGNIKPGDVTDHFSLYDAVPRYAKQFDLTIPDNFPPCESPFEMFPEVAKRGLSIMSLKRWVHWWKQYDFHSEFWLYYMWCVDQDVSHDIRDYLTMKVWPNQPIDLKEKLRRIKEYKISWTGLHREAPLQWSDNDMILWKEFLKENDLLD